MKGGCRVDLLPEVIDLRGAVCQCAGVVEARKAYPAVVSLSVKNVAYPKAGKMGVFVMVQGQDIHDLPDISRARSHSTAKQVLDEGPDLPSHDAR